MFRPAEATQSLLIGAIEHVDLVVAAAVVVLEVHARELQLDLAIGGNVNRPQTVLLGGIVLGGEVDLAKGRRDHLVAAGVAHVGHGQAAWRLPNVAIV